MSKKQLIMKDIHTFATRSLIGMANLSDEDKELELVFPQTSLDWRAKNGGPRDLIILEYNVPCIIDDILRLIERGVKVTVITAGAADEPGHAQAHRRLLP